MFAELTAENTDFFSPCFNKCKCVKVYDGDTIHVVAYLENVPWKFRMRLAGIDTPEIRTKNQEEKKLALLAKEELKKLVLGKILDVADMSYDKYGRILASPKLGEICVSEWMIQHGHAVPYDGGTKPKWCINDFSTDSCTKTSDEK